MPTLLYDQTFLAPGAPSGPTTEQTIDSIGGPTWVELTGIPFNTFGTGSLQIVVTLDAHYTVSGDNEVDAYVAAPGLSAPAFAGANIADVSNPSVLSSYSTLSLSPGTDTFTGPGVATSVYVWCPVVPPSLIGTTMKVKNVRVQVYSLTPSAPTATIDSPAAGTIPGTSALVWDAVAAAGLEGTEGTVTDSTGASFLGFSTAGGFQNGCTGTVVAITNGVRVTLFPPGIPSGSWMSGPLHLHVEVDDSLSREATADRDWTAIGAAISGARDLMAQARSRVIIQYQNSQKLLSLIDALVSHAQEMENLAVQIGEAMDLTTATGLNLARIGEIVGQGQQLSNGDVATDGQYMVLIGARITRNNARVSGADYLNYLVAFFGVQVILSDLGGMTIAYTVMREPTSDEISVLDDDIVARPMGVKVTRSFSAGNGYFGWSDDTNALGFSEIADGGTTGGFWTELF